MRWLCLVALSVCLAALPVDARHRNIRDTDSEVADAVDKVKSDGIITDSEDQARKKKDKTTKKEEASEEEDDITEVEEPEFDCNKCEKEKFADNHKKKCEMCT